MALFFKFQSKGMNRVAALQAAHRPVSILNPGHVRHFALSQGQRAKTLNEFLEVRIAQHRTGIAALEQPALVAQHLNVDEATIAKWHSMNVRRKRLRLTSIFLAR